MKRPEYDTVDEARRGLTGRGIPGDDVERLFDALVPEVDKVVDRYDVDLEEVTNGIRIGAASNIALMIDEETWRPPRIAVIHTPDYDESSSSTSRIN